MIGGHDHEPQFWPVVAQPNVQSPTTAQRQATGSVWEITNPTVPGSGWQITSTLNHPRMFHNAVITPDLKLVVLGGSSEHFQPFATTATPALQIAPTPVNVPEQMDLLSPPAWTGWMTLAQHTSPRLYHSVALLLRDGRILHASGYKGTVGQPPLTHTDAEIFTPPCLQQGLSRPGIINPPAVITYGAAIAPIQVSLPDVDLANTAIDFATLIRCGAVTHHVAPDQRVIKLAVRPTAGTDYRIDLAPLPATASNGHFIAPPGFYYLFLVTTPKGSPLVRVPSVAAIVQVQ